VLSFIATFAEVLSDFGLASTIARMSSFDVLTYGIYAVASDYPVDFPAAGAQGSSCSLLSCSSWWPTACCAAAPTRI